MEIVVRERPLIIAATTLCEGLRRDRLATVEAELEGVIMLDPAEIVAIADGPRVPGLAVRAAQSAGKIGKWIQTVIPAISELVYPARTIYLVFLRTGDG